MYIERPILRNFKIANIKITKDGKIIKYFEYSSNLKKKNRNKFVNKSFDILIFVILKFRNTGLFTLDHSKFCIPPEFFIFNNQCLNGYNKNKNENVFVFFKTFFIDV